MFKNYSLSIIWLLCVIAYASMFVGIENIFAMLPWETTLFFVIAILPFIANYIFLNINKDTNNRIIKLENKHTQIMKEFTTQNIPVESLYGGIARLITEYTTKPKINRLRG